MDIRDIVMRTPYLAKLTRGEISVAERFKDLTSLKIRSALPDMVVGMDDSVKTAMEKCVSMDSPGAVVIDQNSVPVGTLILRDVFMLSEKDLGRMKVKNLWLERPITIGRDSDVTDIIRTFKESRIPILSIVDLQGKFVGTVREREVIMSLGGSVQEQRSNNSDTSPD